jgi:hypothetical protein
MRRMSKRPYRISELELRLLLVVAGRQRALLHLLPPY